MYKILFYSESGISFDQDVIEEFLTDGANDGGIDAIFNGYEWNLRDRTVDNSYNRYINKLSDLGVKFVDNSYTTIYKDVQSINIYGIYYYSLNKYAKKIDPDDPLTLDFIKTVDKNTAKVVRNIGKALR